VAVLEKALRIKSEPVFEAVASRGSGVFETLKAVVKAVLMDLNTR
jgi:DNA-binding phage protein